jgi:hypothetical protein
MTDATGGEMSGIYIVPADQDKLIVRQNYRNTIENPVPHRRYWKDIDPEAYPLIKAHSPDGTTRIWGLEPKKQGIKYFMQMEPGDPLYFSGTKRIYGGGIVIATWWSDPMARKLWPGPSSDEPTWECMFALRDFRKFDLETEAVCRDGLGWKKKDFFQSFIRFEPEVAPYFRQHLPLVP